MKGAAKARSVLLPLLFLGVVALPAIAVALTPLASASAQALAGIGVGVVGSLYGRRVGFGAVLSSALLIGLAGWAAPWPWAAALLMAAAGAGVGACSLRGWHPAAVQACAWPATLLIAPPFEVPGADWASEGIGRILVPALLALLGGLWSAGVAAALGKRLPRLTAKPVEGLSARLYGGALAVLLGLTAFAGATWLRGSTAGWVLLTVLVIVQPALADTRSRLVARSAGTVLGGLLAALLALLVPAPGALVAAGGLAMIAALGLYATGASYARYAFALTTAIVLLNSTGDDVFAVDLQRIGFTLAAAVLIAVLAAVYEPVLRAVLRRRGAAAQEAAPTEATPGE